VRQEFLRRDIYYKDVNKIENGLAGIKKANRSVKNDKSLTSFIFGKAFV
jgi:hypothetical protein